MERKLTVGHGVSRASSTCRFDCRHMLHSTFIVNTHQYRVDFLRKYQGLADCFDILEKFI